MPRGVAPYPWASLERLSRATVRQARAARRAVEGAIRGEERLATALGELLSAEIGVVVRDVRAAPFAAHAEDVAFELSDATLIVVRPEPALATLAVARLLGRTAPVSAPGTPLGPALSGALAALVIEAARRAGAREPLALASARPPDGVPAVRVEGTVLLDGRPYAASAQVVVGRTEPAAVDLASLGELAVSLPLVVALSAADPGTIATLCPGDAWLPGDGWWIDVKGRGRGALAAPASEHGVAVDLAENGAIVVGKRSVPLIADVGEAMSSTKDQGDGGLEDAVLDAPIVVRVELGAVSMTAREWGELRPGDVLETGRRINEPVVLRVAGREVARGDLVEIEGELGVRVREVLGRSGA